MMLAPDPPEMKLKAPKMPGQNRILAINQGQSSRRHGVGSGKV
jgi:hypothetical protein